MLKKYKVTYQENGILKSLILQSDDIKNEELPQNIIEIKSSFNLTLNFRKTISDEKIKNILYELSLMLNSKILLNEAFDILIKNEKKEEIKSFLKSLKNSLINSTNINENLKDFKINSLIKSIFEIIQQSGNPKENINFLSNIINENIETKKEFKKVMIYPSILFITFFLALIGIFEFVVPNFESIFKSFSSKLPIATQILLSTKELFDNHLGLILFTLFLINLIFYLLFKYEKKFKKLIDFLLVEKLSIISHLYRYKNLFIFFVLVEILMKSSYDFLSSFSKAKVSIKNQYLLDKITQIENLLKSGKTIRFAFESANLFDDIVLNLINSGEVSNQVIEVIGEIKKIYKKRFDEKLKVFSLLIEPLFFIIIMALIVWIILAIFVPLWSMSDMLKS